MGGQGVVLQEDRLGVGADVVDQEEALEVEGVE